MDIAELGFDIDSRALEEGGRSLDRLGRSATGAGGRVERMQSSFDGVVNSAGRIDTAVSKLAGHLETATERMISHVDSLDKAFALLELGMATVTKGAKGLASEILFTARDFREAEKESSKLTGTLSGLQKALAFIGLGLGAREILQYSESFTKINNQLAQVTDSHIELNNVMAELFQIAQDGGQSLEGTVSLYTALNRSSEQLGLSQQSLLAVTETVNATLVTGAASASAASASLYQFGQAIASGVLRGDELNSVMEQTPALARAIADGLGVTIGQLRAMGQAGELTSEKLIQALLKQRDAVLEVANTAIPTLSQQIQRLDNAFTVFIGQADKAAGSSAVLGDAIGQVSERLSNPRALNATTDAMSLVAAATDLVSRAFLFIIDNLNVLIGLFAVFLSLKALGGLAIALGTARNAMILFSGALSLVGVQASVASRGLVGFSAALAFASPLAAIVSGLGALAVVLLLTKSRATEAQEAQQGYRQVLIDLGSTVDDVTKKMEDMTAAQKEAAEIAVLTQIEAQFKAIESAAREAQGLINELFRDQSSITVTPNLTIIPDDLVSNLDDVRQAIDQVIAGEREMFDVIEQFKDVEGFDNIRDDLIRLASDMDTGRDATDRLSAILRTLEGTATDADRALYGLGATLKSIPFDEAIESLYKVIGGIKTRSTILIGFTEQVKEVGAAFETAFASADSAENISKLQKTYSEVMQQIVKDRNEALQSLTKDERKVFEDSAKAANALFKEQLAQITSIAQTEHDAAQQQLGEAFALIEAQRAQGLMSEQAYTESKLALMREQAAQTVQLYKTQMDALQQMRVTDLAGETSKQTKILELEAEQTSFIKEEEAKRNEIRQQFRAGYIQYQQELNDELERLRISNIQNERARLEEQLKFDRSIAQRKLDLTYEQGSEEYRVISESLDKIDAQREKSVNRQIEQSSKTVEIYKAAAGNIYNSFVDLFENIQEGGIESFRDLGNSILDIFKKTLAQMAALAIARPVIVPIIQGVGGTLGLSESAISGVAGQFGGDAGGLPSGGGLGNLFSGGGGFLDFLTGNTNNIQQGFSQFGGFLGTDLFNAGTTTSGIGGFLGSDIGTLGAGALAGFLGDKIFGGQGGVGASIGQAIGTAILPGIGTIIGGFLGGAVGGLFGDKKPSNKAAFGSIDLGTLETTTGAFTGKKSPSEETLQIRDAFLETIAATVQGIEKLGGEALGKIFLDIGERDGVQVDFGVGEGIENLGKDAEAALESIIERIVTDAEGLSAPFKQLIVLAEGVEDTLKQIESLSVIQQVLDSNPFEDYAKAVEKSQRSVWDAAIAQRDATLQLVNAYDGSVAATQELAVATQASYQAIIAVIAQIDQLSSSVSQGFSSSIESVQLSILDTEQKYEFYRTKATEAFASLQSAVDPQEIARAAQEFKKYADAAYNLIPDGEGQQEAAGQFIEAFKKAEEIAQAGFQEAREATKQAAQEMKQAIQEAFVEITAGQQQAAAAQQQAANTQLQAANTPQQIIVDVSGAEAGY